MNLYELADILWWASCQGRNQCVQVAQDWLDDQSCAIRADKMLIASEVVLHWRSKLCPCRITAQTFDLFSALYPMLNDGCQFEPEAANVGPGSYVSLGQFHKLETIVVQIATSVPIGQMLPDVYAAMIRANGTSDNWFEVLISRGRRHPVYRMPSPTVCRFLNFQHRAPGTRKATGSGEPSFDPLFIQD